MFRTRSDIAPDDEGANATREYVEVGYAHRGADGRVEAIKKRRTRQDIGESGAVLSLFRGCKRIFV